MYRKFIKDIDIHHTKFLTLVIIRPTQIKTKKIPLFVCVFVSYWGLYSGTLHWATSPALLIFYFFSPEEYGLNPFLFFKTRSCWAAKLPRLGSNLQFFYLSLPEFLELTLPANKFFYLSDWQTLKIDKGVVKWVLKHRSFDFLLMSYVAVLNFEIGISLNPVW